MIGGISGALGLLARDLWSFLAKSVLKIAKFYVWNISADLFMRGKDTHTVLGYVIGFLADIIFGAMLGIIFVYFLKYTSTKNIIIKGWGFGIVAWVLLFGMLIHTLPTVETAPREALGNFSSFIGHSIFGISLGIFAKILLKKFNLLSDGWR
jgi:hypothetical protein